MIAKCLMTTLLIAAGVAGMAGPSLVHAEGPTDGTPRDLNQRLRALDATVRDLGRITTQNAIDTLTGELTSGFGGNIVDMSGSGLLTKVSTVTRTLSSGYSSFKFTISYGVHSVRVMDHAQALASESIRELRMGSMYHVRAPGGTLDSHMNWVGHGLRWMDGISDFRPLPAFGVSSVDFGGFQIDTRIMPEVTAPRMPEIKTPAIDIPDFRPQPTFNVPKFDSSRFPINTGSMPKLPEIKTPSVTNHNFGLPRTTTPTFRQFNVNSSWNRTPTTFRRY